MIRLAINRNGTFHLPVTQSPEYGESEDVVYDLSLFRWGVQTMDEIVQILGTEEPKRAFWHHVIDHLVAYPSDGDGLMVGATLKLTSMHRHWSHLFPIYPLHVALLENTHIANGSRDDAGADGLHHPIDRPLDLLRSHGQRLLHRCKHANEPASSRTR